jgi:hypothetical protein
MQLMMQELKEVEVLTSKDEGIKREKGTDFTGVLQWL